MSLETITTISPITNKPVLTRNGLSDVDLQTIPETAARAFESYRRTALSDRQEIVKTALKLLNERQDALGKELTEQMGRPIAYTAKEISTAVLRGEYMLKISGEALKETEGEAEKGFKRYIKKVPLGPVLILFPWNVRVATSFASASHADLSAVPVADPCKLLSTRFAGRQLSNPEAFPTDADECRACPADIQRSQAARRCSPNFPQRVHHPD